MRKVCSAWARAPKVSVVVAILEVVTVEGLVLIAVALLVVALVVVAVVVVPVVTPPSQIGSREGAGRRTGDITRCVCPAKSTTPTSSPQAVGG